MLVVCADVVNLVDVVDDEDEDPDILMILISCCNGGVHRNLCRIAGDGPDAAWESCLQTAWESCLKSLPSCGKMLLTSILL